MNNNIKCLNCSASIKSDQKFCEFCGTPTNQCPNCANFCAAEALYCDKCGQNLSLQESLTPETSQPKEGAAKLSESLEEMRKHITVMFVDVKDSTALIQNLDPEEARNLLSPILKNIKDAVYQYDGTIVHTLGDGIVAMFGAPKTQEDHALRACLAALRMQSVTESINKSIQIRVGLNSGEVLLEVVGKYHQEYDIAGPVVNLASRMEQTARPGSIQITKSTYVLVENYIVAKSLGSVEIKGFRNAIHVYELAAIKGNKMLFELKDRPTFSRFIGRDKEINALTNLLAEVKKCKSKIVNIVGQTGIGKSRLCYEFIHNDTTRGCTILITGGLTHTKSIYLAPIINLFQELINIEEFNINQDENEIEDILKPLVKHIDFPYALSAALALLDITPKDEKWAQLAPVLKHKYIFQVGLEILSNASKHNTIILVIEDLHWIDSASEEFLNFLFSNLVNAPIFFVMTSRTEFKDNWSAYSHYNKLILKSLSSDNQKILLTELLGTDVSLKPIMEKILYGSDGNPYFMEEMIKLLIADEIIIHTNSHYQINPSALVNKVELPETIYNILQAQIDLLSPLQKNVLQASSVIGEQFAYHLIPQIINISQKELRQTINELIDEQYIYEVSLYPEPIFSFKNAMVQEVFYTNLLISQRKLLHSKLFAFFENSYKDPGPTQIQTIAYHAYLSENWDKAFFYKVKAARNTFLMNALKLALHLFKQALSAAVHIERSPINTEKVIIVHMGIAHIYLLLGQFEKQESHIAKALELAFSSKNIVFQSVLYGFKAIFYLGVRNVNESLEFANYAHELAKKSNSFDALVLSLNALQHVYLYTGQYKKLFEVCHKLIQSLPTLNYLPNLEKIPIGHLAHIILFWVSGQAGKTISKSMQENWLKSINIHQVSVSSHLVNSGFGIYLYLKGDYVEAINYLKRGLNCSIELENILSLPLLYSILGCIYLRQNKLKKGKQCIQQAISIGKSINFAFLTGLGLNFVCEGSFLLGDYQKTKELLTLAFNICEERQLLATKSILFRINAEVDLKLPNPDYLAIEKQLKQALQMTKKRGLLAEVAHCHFALAKFYQHIEDDVHFKKELEYSLNSYKEFNMPYWISQCEELLKDKN